MTRQRVKLAVRLRVQQLHLLLEGLRRSAHQRVGVVRRGGRRRGAGGVRRRGVQPHSQLLGFLLTHAPLPLPRVLPQVGLRQHVPVGHQEDASSSSACVIFLTSRSQEIRKSRHGCPKEPLPSRVYPLRWRPRRNRSIIRKFDASRSGSTSRLKGSPARREEGDL